MLQNKGSSKNWLVFFKINILNFPLVFIASFFKPVAYWKSSKIPKSFLRFFHPLEPENIFKDGQMEWNAISSNAYDRFSSILRCQDWCSYKTMGRFNSKTIDFTSVAVSEISENFEAYYQFEHMVDKWKESSSRVSSVTIVGEWHRHAISSFTKGHTRAKEDTNSLFILVDRLAFFLENLLIVMLSIRKLVFCLKGSKRLRNKSFQILWKDVSVNEITESLLECNFAFLLHYTPASVGKILYVLPKEPTHKVRQWLKNKNINWIVEGECIYLVPYIERLRAAKDIAFAFVGIGLSSALPVAKRRIPVYIAQGAPLYCVVKACNIGTIIGTSSGHNSCGPLNSLAKSSDVRTIIWQYSQAGVIPVKRSGPYNSARRNRLVQSIFPCDEQWVWYHKDLSLFKDRCLQPVEYAPIFRVIGPIMSGNSSWIFKSSDRAREDMQLPECSKKGLLWVGVFDIDTKHPSIISGSRAGPNRFSIEMQKAFFKDLCEALDVFPNLRLIYKPKRRVAKEKFVVSKEMLELTSPDGKYVKKGKVVLVKYNIDPYIPIAMSDCCIGAPYTSGVLLSNLVKRPGVYYDSLGVYNNCYPSEYIQIQVSKKKALFEKIQSWERGKSIADVGFIANESIDENFAEDFVKLLEL